MIACKRRPWAGTAILIISLPLMICAQDQNSQTKAGTGVISGKVLTRDGESLSNVRVTVSRYGAANSTQTFRADGSGAFTSEQLEPGLYGVSAYAPGYIYDTSVQPTSSTGYYHPGDTPTFTLIKGGVITGTVKNANGDPITAVPVRAIRVRDQEGKNIPFQISLRDRVTDDRGVYRLYGLPPGTYVVSAGGQSRFPINPPTAFESDTPIYAPSSTRDGAAEIAVNSGDEVTADIQYRSEPGHIISGVITGSRIETGTTAYAASVSITDLRTRTDLVGTSTSVSSKFVFSIYGIPDGEYELYANQGSSAGENLISPPLRVKVLGRDVTGLTLTVAPMASIEGRVVLQSDPKAACGKRRESAMLETMILARRFEQENKSAERQTSTAPTLEVPSRFRSSASQSALDTRGTFNLKNLQPGTFRLEAREPASGWFTRSITFERPARPLNIPRDGLTLKDGEHVAGLLVTLGEGAGKLQGQISMGEGKALPQNLRVYLTPSERENADNTLRFYETRPTAQGSFTVDNIAPGKYWIVAHPLEESDTGAVKSIRLDKDFRLKVQRDAEALKKEVTLKPCEQLANYDLPFGAVTSPQ